MWRLDGVGFRTQRRNGFLKDCGAACVAGFVEGMSVVDVLKMINHPKDEALDFDDMRRALDMMGIPHEHRWPLTVNDIRADLSTGKPSILLVGYGRLPEALKQYPFDGAHFVVAVGFTQDDILVHDSLALDEAGGAFVPWPDGVVSDALGNPGWGNMPEQGIVIHERYAVQDSDLVAEFDRVRAVLLQERKRYADSLMQMQQARKKPL